MTLDEKLRGIKDWLEFEEDDAEAIGRAIVKIADQAKALTEAQARIKELEKIIEVANQNVIETNANLVLIKQALSRDKDNVE